MGLTSFGQFIRKGALLILIETIWAVLVIHLGNLSRNSADRLTDCSPYVHRMPGYLKTHIIIITNKNVSQFMCIYIARGEGGVVGGGWSK